MYGGDLSEIKILLLLFLLSISTDLKLLQFVFKPHNRRRVIRREKTHKCRRASFFGSLTIFLLYSGMTIKIFEANRFLF